MGKRRREVILAIARGLLAAIALTLLGMAGIAALAVYARASDSLIRGLNQALKCASILLGAVIAIGRGGQRGFVTGMALAMLYMALGCAMAALLGRVSPTPAELLGEIMIAAALGGAAGSVLANLPARRRRVKSAA